MVTTTSKAEELMEATYFPKDHREEPLSMDDSEAVALLQLLNGTPDRSSSLSPASSCDTTANIPNEQLDTPRMSDSDRSMASPSPSLQRRGMRKRKPCARFDGTEEEPLPLDSPPSMPRRPTAVRKLAAPPRPRSSTVDDAAPEAARSSSTLLDRCAPATRPPAAKHAPGYSSSSSSSAKQASSSSSSSCKTPSLGGSYNKYCHFCQHVKVKHTTSMYACSNMDCQRRYCDYCLRVHLGETGMGAPPPCGGGGGGEWECPHCRKACCCTHGKCEASHRHCKAYRYRLLRASQAGMRMAARAGGARVKAEKRMQGHVEEEAVTNERKEEREAGSEEREEKEGWPGEADRGRMPAEGARERPGKGSVAALMNDDDDVCAGFV